MSSKYKIQDQSQIYFLTFTVVNLLDVFTRIKYKEVIEESLRYCTKEKGMELYAWVIMTNHVHLIAATKSGRLEDTIRDMKRHTAKQLLYMIKEHPAESRRELFLWLFQRAGKRNSNNQEYQFWQQGSHPIELNTNALMQQKLDYLHENQR